MSFLPGMRPVPFIAASGAPVMTFGGHYVSAADATAYTSGSIDIGSATGVRSVFVATRTSGKTSGVKVGGSGGVALTEIHDDFATTFMQFWGGLIPTGTSATIYVTCASSNRMGLGVWHAQNVNDPTTVIDTASYPNGTNSQTIDVSEGGFLLAMGLTTGSVNMTFDDITTDFNEPTVESGIGFHGGSLGSLSAATGRTLAFTTASGNYAAAAVSIR